MGGMAPGHHADPRRPGPRSLRRAVRPRRRRRAGVHGPRQLRRHVRDPGRPSGELPAADLGLQPRLDHPPRHRRRRSGTRPSSSATSGVWRWFGQVSGSVFNDNGDGGGTAGDGVRQPGEPGIRGMDVGERWRDGSIKQGTFTDNRRRLQSPAKRSSARWPSSASSRSASGASRGPASRCRRRASCPTTSAAGCWPPSSHSSGTAPRSTSASVPTRPARTAASPASSSTRPRATRPMPACRRPRTTSPASRA